MQEDSWSFEDMIEKSLQAVSITYDKVTDRVDKAFRNGQFIDDTVSFVKDMTSGKLAAEVTDEMWSRNHSTGSTNPVVVTDPQPGNQGNLGNQGNSIKDALIKDAHSKNIVVEMVSNYLKKVASLDDDGSSETLYLYDIVKDVNVANYVETKFPTIRDYSNLKPFAQRYKEMKIQFSFDDIVAILLYFRGK